MAYTTRPTEKLIKFVRGTTAQFELITKQEDTLYFIYDSVESTTGKLYLGDKQIGDGSPTEIGDLITGEFNAGDLLVYDEDTESWVAESVDNAVRIMTGATAVLDGQSGLVPVPRAGDQNKFLRGDGTWATPSSSLMAVDNVTLETNANDEIALKGFDTAAVGTIPKKTESGLQWVTPGAISGSLSYRKVESLSDVTEENTIFLVPNQSSTLDNIYDEYMLIDNQVERVGGMGSVDLNGYVTTTEFNTAVGSLQTELAAKTDQSDFDALSNTVNIINERLSWQEMYDDQDNS